MPHLSIVIPAHNEEKNLAEVVQGLVANPLLKNLKKEIIIVNDNSADRTLQVAVKLAREHKEIRIVNRSGNPSFGEALRAGIKVATGGIIVHFMGDLSDDPGDVHSLVTKIHEGYDVAFGSRFIEGGKAEGYSWLKFVFNRLFSWLVRTLFKTNVRDVTNAFKGYRREVIKSLDLKCRGFDINAEIPIKVFLKGYKVAETPVIWHARRKGEAKFSIRKEGIPFLKTTLVLYFKSIIGCK